MGLFDKLQSKLDLYRLEQKYARRKNRNTFTTGAVYQDGEYVYTADGRTPTMSTNSTGNSNSSSESSKRRTQMWMPPTRR